MPYLAEETELGKLEMRDVYIYYDFPRLFTCVNEYGKEYLALSIGETETEYSWVYATVSSKRLASIASGEVDLRDAFKEPESGGVLLVSISAEGDRVVPVLPSDVPDVVLPKRGQKLHLPKKREISVSDASSLLSGSGSNIVGMIDVIKQAFLDVRGDFSVDKVIADPELGKTFLRRCQSLGLNQPDYILNRKLMGMRKASQIPGLNSKKYIMDRTISNSIDYASELAWRYLELTKGISLDDILCNPNLAIEFDKLASSISPGFKSFEYRWTALQVRKSRTLAKKGKDLRDTFVFADPVRVDALLEKDMPKTGGLYLFLYNDNPLFVSQAESLRQRLVMHFDSTSSRGLPEWIWPDKHKIIEVAFASLPGMPKTKRQGMEIDQVSLKKPIFNIQQRHVA